MATFQVVPGVHAVGAVDWDIRYFHGPAYSTHRGTSYNSYVIVDDKVAVVDTVYQPFTEEFVDNLRQVADPESIDYVIVNHIEPDHSGALPALMELCPQATVVCTEKARQGLKAYFNGQWNYQTVKTGDSLSLGKLTLQFLEAPMLHWPDSMFTYVPERKLLLPNDAFGQHYASSQPFDDQNDMDIVMAEAGKYYANILSPFSRLVTKKLQEVADLGLEIDIIAPSHGVIWRSHPEKIIQAYARWAAGEARLRMVVVYDTMWGSTEQMARAVVAGAVSRGVSARLFKASVSDRNDIIAELLDSRALVVGSPTINNDMLPVITPLLEELKGLKPVNKVGAAFGSHGWRGGAVEAIEHYLQEAGIEPVQPAVKVQWAPGEDVIKQCHQLGAEIADSIKDD